MRYSTQDSEKAIRAYGNWESPLSRLLHSVLWAVNTVESEYKQALAPNTPALTTAPQFNNTLECILIASGTISGIATAYNPQDDPVVTAIRESEANTIRGRNCLLI